MLVVVSIEAGFWSALLVLAKSSTWVHIFDQSGAQDGSPSRREPTKASISRRFDPWTMLTAVLEKCNSSWTSAVNFNSRLWRSGDNAEEIINLISWVWGAMFCKTGEDFEKIIGQAFVSLNEFKNDGHMRAEGSRTQCIEFTRWTLEPWYLEFEYFAYTAVQSIPIRFGIWVLNSILNPSLGISLLCILKKTRKRSGIYDWKRKARPDPYLLCSTVNLPHHVDFL